MTIIAAADGSALGNPGPAGWAWYVDDDHWACGGWPNGTNNMGELMAVLDLLQQTAHLDESLHVFCDSLYVINSVTKWMKGWKRKGWKKGDGKPVLNIDLMKALDAAMEGRAVTFEWVKGHSGHPLNEEADRLANSAAGAWKTGRAPEPGPGYPGASTAHPEARPGQVEEEPDLFSDLVVEPTAPVGGATDSPAPSGASAVAPAAEATAQVVAAERALLRDAVLADQATLASYLHPDWSRVDEVGQHWTREDWLARAVPVGEVDLEVVSVEQVDDATVLLVWHSHDTTGTSTHSTWWLRVGHRWVQRFHHVSRAAR